MYGPWGARALGHAEQTRVLATLSHQSADRGRSSDQLRSTLSLVVPDFVVLLRPLIQPPA